MQTQGKNCQLCSECQEVQQATNSSSGSTGPGGVPAQPLKIPDICEIKKWDENASHCHKSFFSLQQKLHNESVSISLVSKDN